MKINLILAWLIGLSLLTGCSMTTEQSNSVSQDRISQEYSVEYDSETNTTEASASFHFGNTTGTTLILSDGAYIILNAVII